MTSNDVKIPKKKKIAVISSFGVVCGISHYAECLSNALEESFEVHRIPIDVELMRSVRIGSYQAKKRFLLELAQKINTNFDFVNIQLEFGLFGSSFIDMMPNFIWFINNLKVKKIVFSMHTNPQIPGKVNLRVLFEKIAKLQIKQIIKYFAEIYLLRILPLKALKTIAKLTIDNKAALIFFNESDNQKFQILYNSKHSYTSPLAFFNKDFYTKISGEINNAKFRKKYNIKTTDIVIGHAGILGSLKGIEITLEALALLPKNYKFFIGGGTSITRPSYTHNVNNEGVDKALYSIINKVNKLRLNDRVIFAGTLSNEELAEAITHFDVLVLPYRNTPQTTSGPASIGIELANNIIVSNTFTSRSMLELSKGSLELFEIGNSIQLSQKILEVLSQKKNRPRYFHISDTVKLMEDFSSNIK